MLRLHLVQPDGPDGLGHGAARGRAPRQRLGLYDLDRRQRPVGHAYEKLVREWGPAVAQDTWSDYAGWLLPWQ